MKITIDPVLLSDTELVADIHEANRFLENEAGAYGQGFHAEWGVARKPGKFFFNIGNGESVQMSLADRSLLADRERREFMMLQAAR